MIIAAALLIGAAVGAVNGFLAAYVRIQPIVATLGTYLVLVGVTLTILPSPMGTVPDWLKLLSGSLSIIPLAAIFLLWWGIRRLPYYDHADGDRLRRPRRLHRRRRRARSSASCPT